MEGFFCGIFCLVCKFSRKYPSVKPAACQLPFQGSLIITSPERGGEPAKLVEGFLWNLLLGVKDLRKNSSVSLRLPAQHKARPAGALSGKPIFEKKAAKQKEHLPQDHSRAEMLFCKQIGFTLLLRPFQHASARRLPDLRLHTNSVGRKSW